MDDTGSKTSILPLRTRYAMCALLILGTWLLPVVLAAHEPASHWRMMGRNDLDQAWMMTPNWKIAKNLILMIGDGMGLPSVTAGRIYKGQKMKQNGEDYKLKFETFPYVALSKTYNLDRQVPDSAGTAMAMVTGVKVNFGTLGVTGDVPYKQDCSMYMANRTLMSVLDHALMEGKSVGIVTTTRITHATPASAYAHIPWRDWESDTDMVNATNCQSVKDIAYQLVMNNTRIQVLLGGGRRSFINNTTPDPRTNVIDKAHQRSDGMDLREWWKKEKMSRGVSHAYVETKGQFDAVDPDKTDYLFGLFASSHMTYTTERKTTPDGEPSLTEMVDKAIKILKRNPKGYFLLIEGGRIDHGHHDNYGKRALEEVVEFDNAVIKVTEMTTTSDTLTIVTADHSHVFGMAGYPSRGNNILGTVDIVANDEKPFDGKPYLTLGYLNGPSFTQERRNYSTMDTTVIDFQQPGCVQMLVDTHGGEDVSIYAQGPMAHMFHSTHEQSYIGHVLMYSACLGDYKDNCDEKKRMQKENEKCGAIKPTSSVMLLLMVLVATVLRFSE